MLGKGWGMEGGLSLAVRPPTGHPKPSVGSGRWAVADPGLIIVPLLPEVHGRVTELCSQQFTNV